MSRNNSIPFSILYDTFSGVRGSDIDYSKLFPRGYDDSPLMRNTKSRISIDKYAHILRELWDLTDDESAGYFKTPFKRHSFPVLAHAAISAGSLRNALNICSIFFQLIGEDLVWELHEYGSTASLNLKFLNSKELDPAYPLLTWYTLIIRFSSWLINKPFHPECINFKCDPPPYIKEYRIIFPCSAYFNQQNNSLFFSSYILDLPIDRRIEDLENFLRNAPENLLSQYREDSSLSGKVRKILQSNNGHTQSLVDVASILQTTTYTLQRNLKREGITFLQIKDSVIKRFAIDSLLYSDKSIGNIAFESGYSESASFNHAFRNWTGVSPGVFRKLNKD